MKQKKTMKLWQMITLLILSVVILVTMFLPAYHIDSDALKKGMENAQIEDNYYKSENARDKDIRWYAKKFNKAINREKKENGTDNASISVLKLMTNSLAEIRYNGKYDEEYTESEMGSKTYDALNKKHCMTKILLWIIYSLVLVEMLIVILGYCLKWNKYITLTISIIYGVFASITFAILRFGTVNGTKKKIGSLTETFIGYEFNNVDNAKIVSGFISYAFLLGLIVSVVFLTISIISMFAGNQTDMAYNNAADGDSMDEWDKDWNQARTQMQVPRSVSEQELKDSGYSGDIHGVAPFGDKNKRDADMSNQESLTYTIPSMVPVQESPAKPMIRSGKVRCTKGMTSGSSGYSLSPDRKVIVGKSPHKANLVIVNNTHISNVHCTIRYDSTTDTYIVKDHSTNGTYVNGTRLQKEVSMKYPAGTVLSLADRSVEITLG